MPLQNHQHQQHAITNTLSSRILKVLTQQLQKIALLDYKNAIAWSSLFYILLLLTYKHNRVLIPLLAVACIFLMIMPFKIPYFWQNINQNINFYLVELQKYVPSTCAISLSQIANLWTNYFSKSDCLESVVVFALRYSESLINWIIF